MLEKVIVKERSFLFTHNIRDNEPLRKSFNQLAEDTFQISFENWYQNHYWDENYIPYALIDDNKVVANASVNIIKTSYKGVAKTYIQIGTVMTAIGYRQQGLADFLITKIIKDWQNQADAIYLFANDSVLDFYPKYGFVVTQQYQFSKPVTKQASNIRKLDMASAKDRDILYKTYQQSNPFSLLPMLANKGLLMFYCSQFLVDNIYYLEDDGVVAVVDYAEEEMLCYDVFGATQQSLTNILSQLAQQQSCTVKLGFAPIDSQGFTIELYKAEDTTLFFYKAKENQLKAQQLMLPLLSHA